MSVCVRERSVSSCPPLSGRVGTPGAHPRPMSGRRGKRGRAEATALGLNEVTGPRVRRKKACNAAAIALEPAAAVRAASHRNVAQQPSCATSCRVVIPDTLRVHPLLRTRAQEPSSPTSSTKVVRACQGCLPACLDGHLLPASLSHARTSPCARAHLHACATASTRPCLAATCIRRRHRPRTRSCCQSCLAP